MDKQGYEGMINFLTEVIEKKVNYTTGLCYAARDIEGSDWFFNTYIPGWKDIASSGNQQYPISTSQTLDPSDEYGFVKDKYADTPYGDARRRLAAFLRSKAEEELALLVGEEHEKD